MEQRNNKQGSMILDIEKVLNKMSNQVNFLIRKDIQINQFDIDLLMENTRKLYDLLCSVELGKNNEELEVISSDDNNDAIALEKFEEEIDEIEESQEVKDFEEEYVEKENIEETEEIVDDDSNADMVWDFTQISMTEVDEENDIEDDVEEENDNVYEDDYKEIDEDEIDNFEESNDDIETEDYNIVEEEEEEEEEFNIPSPITNIYSAQKEEDSGIRTYKIVRENAPTIIDKLEQNEDISLAARLQRKPVADLISAIGINDKFLFLNDLFGGSMDKYNKSIRSLNSFSTLLGAKTYMSELQIEFQWDCDSDAYKKLADLIERRFL